MKQINLEEILKSKINEAIGSTTILNEFEFNIKKDVAIIEAMKEACKQVLELAAENARIKFIHDDMDLMYGGYETIDKKSILNIINQVK